jgi:hypothetical protein
VTPIDAFSGIANCSEQKRGAGQPGRAESHRFSFVKGLGVILSVANMTSPTIVRCLVKRNVYVETGELLND